MTIQDDDGGTCAPGGTTIAYAGSHALQFENNYFTEMCSGSEAGSYVRLIDFVYHSTLGLRVIQKRRRRFHTLLP